jgi:hypothetical protein
MVKHILGQAIFQSIVILTILFGGPGFIAEEFCANGTIYADKVGGAYCDTPTVEKLQISEIQSILKVKNPDYLQDLEDKWAKGQFYILLGMVQDEK